MPQETFLRCTTTERPPQNIRLVKNIVEANPKTSVWRISQQVGLCQRSAHAILKKDISLKPYKIQVAHKLEPQDYEKRKQFASWFINQCELNLNFIEKIIMSDEEHFCIDG